MESALEALIAASVSFLFVSVVLAFLILVCRRPSKTYNSRGPGLPVCRRTANPASFSASFDPSLVHVSMADLEAATRNFSPDCIVGDGSFGFVYKAHLPDGTAVAVKRLSADAFDGLREFSAEMETLGRIRHRNLARMLGYCAAGRDRVLIYEFLERGSLDQWLHDVGTPSPAAREPLSWQTRLRVVRGVAAGLAFLHCDCKPRIIHRDIKASNILLADDFEARITDFGLARRVESSRSHVSTQVAGTMGYMAPEYRDGLATATAKADVYSFGALMFEVATGKRPNWPVPVGGGKEVPLVRWARGMVEAGSAAAILDPTMGGEGPREEAEVKGFLDAAHRCTHDRSKDRPTMEEVVSLLGRLGSDGPNGPI